MGTNLNHTVKMNVIPETWIQIERTTLGCECVIGLKTKWIMPNRERDCKSKIQNFGFPKILNNRTVESGYSYKNGGLIEPAI